ncbi:MAG: hypothetical protein K8J31_26810 [Anaerolineae bacterium]|nr:hypothetical protein [Anaerolineae bacterium]
MAARAAAGINLYEISPRTLGGISSLEIASDPFRDQEPMVIYFSDGDPARDEVPAHLPQGYPLFQPHAIHESERAMHAHYQEFIKNANHMRKYLMSFAREMDTLTVNFSDQIHEGDVVITPERLHAAELFRAVVQAASRQRTTSPSPGAVRPRREGQPPVHDSRRSARDSDAGPARSVCG